jgi:hypothetical protein
MYRPCTGYKGSHGSILFIIYIGCTGHIEAMEKVSRPSFFFIYIGCTGQLQDVGEVSGATFFITYI